MGKVKELQSLEEGYVKVVLKNRKDVDSYMLNLINQESRALPCLSKKNATTCFLYDVRAYLPLSSVCEIYQFDEKTILSFLLRLFQALRYIEEQYPYVLHMDMIYFDPTLEDVKFVILPIHDHFNEENDWTAFLHALMANLQLEDDAILGWLYRLFQSSQNQAYALAEAIAWKQKHGLRTALLKLLKKRNRQKQRELENQQRLQAYFEKQTFYAQSVRSEEQKQERVEVRRDTVEIFPTQDQAMLKQGENLQEISASCIIGRDLACDYVMESPSISSQHAKITRVETGWQIEDMNSCNGTKVNKRKVTTKPRQLHSLDEIQIADVTLIFLEGEATS